MSGPIDANKAMDPTGGIGSWFVAASPALQVAFLDSTFSGFFVFVPGTTKRRTTPTRPPRASVRLRVTLRTSCCLPLFAPFRRCTPRRNAVLTLIFGLVFSLGPPQASRMEGDDASGLLYDSLRGHYGNSRRV